MYTLENFTLHSTSVPNVAGQHRGVLSDNILNIEGKGTVDVALPEEKEKGPRVRHIGRREPELSAGCGMR